MTCCCGHTKKQHDNYDSTIKYAWGEGCMVCRCEEYHKHPDYSFSNDKSKCSYCDEDYKFECKGWYKRAGEWFKMVNGLQVKA
jgi:hypothetical protein